jgi:hypothetical protein
MRKYVNETFFWLCAVLVAPMACAESFPAGDVFRPLIADPLEPRFFVSVLSLDAPKDTLTAGSVGAGTNFGLYRWPGDRAGEGWQIGVAGAVFSQFNLDAPSKDLINTDFRIGIPLSYKRGPFSTRASIYHQSSHLGDEFILSGVAPRRVNFSYEALNLAAAWEFGGWRPYAGGFYMLHGDPSSLKKPGWQAGVDYAGHEPVLAGARLVGGVDMKSFSATNWDVGVSAKIGLEFGRPRPERRGVTVLLEAFDGPAPWGQFYRDKVTTYGLSLQFDL